MPRSDDSQSRIRRVFEMPDWAAWFLLGMCAGVFLTIIALAVFSNGSIYADPGGVAF